MQSLVAEFSPVAIVHLAALVSVPESMADPDLNTRLNFTATQRVAEAARQHGVRRIVFDSSAAVYGVGKGPISPYGTAKLASEKLLLGQAALSARCLRYFNVFGPRQDPRSPYSGVISVFARRFREGQRATVYGDGLQTRDFISVHDVARANVLAATRPDLASGAIDICTGRATSLRRLLELFGDLYPQSPPPEFGPARPGDIRSSVGDPSAARGELSFVAQWTVEEGLNELIALKVH